MSRRLAGAAAAVLIALLAAASPAADTAKGAGDGPPLRGQLRIEALLGFAGTFRPGHWTPLTVTLHNRGEPINGRLEVVTRDGDEFRRSLYPVVHHRPLQLGRDARRRFHFTVYLETLSRPVEIRVVSGDEVLAREALDLRHRFTSSRLVLVLSRDADLDYLNAGGEDGVRALYPHPGQLPQRWQGYDGVAAVVLHGLSLETLEASQFDALTRWLARGGVLAVSGGPDYALLSTPRLASLLPATPRGLTPISDTVSVGAALGAPLTAPGAFHVNRVAGIRGEVLHQAAGVPLVIEAPRGHGRVLYLTFDVARYPFDRWPAMHDVWTRLLALNRPARAPVHRPDTPSLVPTLLQVQAPGFPGHGTLLLFLALYLCLLATAYRIRRAGAPERRWLSLPAVAIPGLFAPAAYALFNVVLFQPGTTVTLLSVVEPLPDSRFATLQVDLGVHTNRKDDLVLTFDRRAPAFRVPLQARRDVDARGWRAGRESVAPTVAKAYELHLLEGQDTIDFELEARISESAQLDVRNDTGRAIEDAWLVYRGTAWFLGTLDADARSDFDLTREPDVVANDRDEWWPALASDPRVDRHQLRMLAEALERRVDARDSHSYPDAGHALLVGFTTTPLRLAGASAGWRRTEVTVVLLRFPAWLPSGDEIDETGETT